ncbi:MAG TPA: hypothetical protein VGO62_04215, partial [Myxococcota bacterium]
GTWHRATSSSSPNAQALFDQGLRYLYGFNHGAALDSFARAESADATCAMCFWAEAVANGPHINNPDLDDAHARAALLAAHKAKALASTASPVERALIDAINLRYSDPPGPRPPLDEAYARAMMQVHAQFPDDVDVSALAAEALMDLRPWDQWTSARPGGQMQPHTQEIIDLLASALQKAPTHPLANHLWIHLWEQSPTPERADDAADRLRTMAPALAHLVHMPSHIDVRRGRFRDAIATSENALAADRAYLARTHETGFYLFYVAHNQHMLAYAAMMSAQKNKALAAVDAMVTSLPSAWLKDNASVADGIEALPLEVRMRFGMWDEILAAPDFAADLPMSRALRHAARAVALAAKGAAAKAGPAEGRAAADLASARVEAGSLVDEAKALPLDARFGDNDAHAVLAIASKLVDGELAAAEHKSDDAIRLLREAVTLEDALKYDEPPDWMQPARHALGAVLVNAGKLDEARAVYRDDLERIPNNAWSVLGLSQSLPANASPAERAAITKQLADAWRDADIAPTTSCLCQTRNP